MPQRVDVPSRRQKPRPPASLSRRLTIAWVVLVVVALAGWGIWSLHEAAEAERARYRAYDEAQRQQVDYRSESFACALRFPSGSTERAGWQEDSFRWQALQPELATSSDDSEGEQWAEFYVVPDDVARQRLLRFAHADLDHPLVRRRLEQNFYPGSTYEVDKLSGQLNVYASGTQDGWSVRAAWYAAPFGHAWTQPPTGPRDAIDRRDILDHLATEQPWLWRTLEELPDRGALEDYRREERKYTAGYQKAADRDRMHRHFLRSHRHFYIVDAASEVQPGKILILRRFGSLQGGHTLAGAARRIHDMVRSLRCSAAESGADGSEAGAAIATGR
jgi:hypothetical protein